MSAPALSGAAAAPSSQPSAAAPLLAVRLDARYGKDPVLDQVRFNLNRGEALGLIGTSGAGKSTLVLSLIGLLSWRGGEASGQVLFEGQDLLTMPERALRRLRGRAFALVPQSPMSALNGALTLRTHFEEAWRAHRPALATREEYSRRVDDLLDWVQIPQGRLLLDRKPGQISVGQAQRIMIALALLHQPALLIADEPTSALDPVTQAEILALLGRLNREHGVGLLYVSHDLLSVMQLCSRVVVLDQGTIAESETVERLDQSAHPATRALLGALPVPHALLRQHGLLGRRPDGPLSATAAKPIFGNSTLL